ncbi:hypothetical protein Acr_03g0018640 [Actinidia rufa]|uniref:Xylanase inhibitor C-terminal domain-containing protein n=1 Tax=Actinidia rufa TaxID=165716 RepID=A0A7J0EFC8_9ERIC|nr:hypothetical protein Acr_03g0018640 [Actinidia rufa]
MIFFGDGPYYLLPPTNLDGNSIISYTPLIKKPKSPVHFIGLNSISIDGNPIQIPTKPAKLSTVIPYTTLRTDIYKSFIKIFSKASMGLRLPRTKTIAPFGLCFKARVLEFTRVGFRVPQIDLELGSGRNWTVFRANSMQ